MTKRRRNSYRLAGHDYSDPSYAYFITLRARIKHVANGSPVNPRQPFTSCRALGQQANDSLLFYRAMGKLLVFAYCIMPDHVHILASPLGGANLSFVLGRYQSHVTSTAWDYGVVGKLWQRSYYDSITRSPESRSRVIRYILQNPVRAGLVRHWTDWPWCGTPDPWQLP